MDSKHVPTQQPGNGTCVLADHHKPCADGGLCGTARDTVTAYAALTEARRLAARAR